MFHGTSNFNTLSTALAHWVAVKYPESNGTIGDFRFEYEYEIEYENDFSILVCRLHIVTSHTYLIPWATFST